MLQPAHRLRRSDDFRRTVRQGARASTRTLVLHYLPGSPQRLAGAAPRIGFVVGRDVGGAVARNRVIRRLRHLLRERIDALGPGSMLVVRARPEAASAASTLLAADVDRGLAVVTQASARQAQPLRPVRP